MQLTAPEEEIRQISATVKLCSATFTDDDIVKALLYWMVAKGYENHGPFNKADIKAVWRHGTSEIDYIRLTWETDPIL